MAKKEENPLFVGIANENELRRNMLECSKCILESLKGNEKFKAAREEKIKMIDQLRSDVKNIAKYINALRAYLPKVNDVGIKRMDVKKVREEKPKMVKVEKPQGKTELERLEAELNEIENKLNSLS